MPRIFVLVAALLILVGIGDAADAPTTPGSFTGEPATRPAPVPLLSPEEEIETFNLPAGLRAEVVACEPMVEHPVAIAFDPDGRLWVAEMRAYMPDVDGWGENKPTGRISVLEDLDGDGRMDKSTVFLDRLVLPRAIGFANGGVLVGAPPNLLFCRDTDGDLKSDEQTVIATDFGVVENPENFANGLLWGLDNWIYNADHDKRFGWRDGKLEWAPMPVLGQWGISHDDVGRFFFNTNSDHLRASLIAPHYSSRNPTSPMALADTRIATDQSVWPAHAATVNRGYREGFLRENGRLKDFTAACSPLIYRGTLFGPDFYGNAFVCEATSNLVRRSILVPAEDGIRLSARNAYDQREFIASTYERFRPVSLQAGPEGAIYVVDMHHGLIQHRMSLTQYAKEQYLAKQLNKHLKTGRIFRIVPESGAPPARPRLRSETTAELVLQLTHPEGWWRDTAQRLLVERKDPAAIEPLRALVRQGSAPVHRLHALWTLDGMGAMDAATLRCALADADPDIRAAALRVSEPIMQAVWEDVAKLRDDPQPRVRLQLALSAGGQHAPEALGLMAAMLHEEAGNVAMRQAIVSGLAGREIAFIKMLLNDPGWRDEAEGRSLVFSDLARSVTRRQEPNQIKRLVKLIAFDAGKDAWQQVAMLEALPAARRDEYGTARPIEVDHEPDAIGVLEASSVAKVRAGAARVSALFTWPGKPVPPRPKPAPLTPRQQALFELGKAQFALTCAQCHQPTGIGQAGKAPPLVNSPWVLGSQNRLIRIVLHGMRGPVNVGETSFNLDMPAWPTLSDEQVAGILTYIRRSWGHEAAPIDPATVQNIRDWTQARRDGWTEKELLQIR